MKVLVQRSKHSYVKVNDKIVGQIDHGYVLFVSFSKDDTTKNIDKLIPKIVNLRIFDDSEKVMNKSILDVSGSALSISQFTLYASTKKGNRPSYVECLNKDEAQKLYGYFNSQLEKFIKVEKGIFHEDMEVHITNDGPVTIMLEG